MAIPDFVQIQRDVLPDDPGVYFYYDCDGELLYIGKATSLKKRVGSYFNKAHDRRIAELVGKIRRIDYIETKTSVEALVLEANQINVLQPPYNILNKDDKSFLYLLVTSTDFPRPVLIRGHELAGAGVAPFAGAIPEKLGGKYRAMFGPYTSSYSLKKAMELIRRAIPWSVCRPPEETGSDRLCFDAQIGKCPGVCGGKISKQRYRRMMKRFEMFFGGKTARLLGRMKKEMEKAAKEMRFEEAAEIRNALFSLEHIRDIAMITKEDVELPMTRVDEEMYVDLEGWIEAYDISNISGTSAVGSMVVFFEGRPLKAAYRKFKIKTVIGADDVGCMEEVMRRRLKRALRYPKAWGLPEIMVIDGGEGQVNRVREVFAEMGVDVPLIGIAKGYDRKQDRLVFDRGDVRVEVFCKARDEAHRFAVKYHKEVRSRASGIRRGKKKTSG